MLIKKVMYRKANTHTHTPIQTYETLFHFLGNPNHKYHKFYWTDMAPCPTSLQVQPFALPQISTSRPLQTLKLVAMLQVPMALWFDTPDPRKRYKQLPWAMLKIFISTHLTEICRLVSFPKAWSTQWYNISRDLWWHHIANSYHNLNVAFVSAALKQNIQTQTIRTQVPPSLCGVYFGPHCQIEKKNAKHGKILTETSKNSKKHTHMT